MHFEYSFFVTNVKKDVFLVRQICSIRVTCLKTFPIKETIDRIVYNLIDH